MEASSKGNPLTRDTKWLIGLLLPMIMATFSAVYFLGSMSERFKDVESSTERLHAVIQKLIEDDITDLKKRMTIQEAKDILPRAERNIADLEKRVRDLEKRN